MSKKLYYDTQTGWAVGLSETNETLFFHQTQASIETADAGIISAVTDGKPVRVIDGVPIDVSVKDTAVAGAIATVAGAGNAADQQVAFIKQLMIERGITPL